MVNGTLLCKILWILPRDERHRHIIQLEQKDIAPNFANAVAKTLNACVVKWHRLFQILPHGN